MVAFILLTFGLWGLVLTAAGTRLTLPYYGAENIGPQPARVTLYGYPERSSASSIATALEPVIVYRIHPVSRPLAGGFLRTSTCEAVSGRVAAGPRGC